MFNAISELSLSIEFDETFSDDIIFEVSVAVKLLAWDDRSVTADAVDNELGVVVDAFDTLLSNGPGRSVKLTSEIMK